jgi:hypothetical protein
MTWNMRKFMASACDIAYLEGFQDGSQIVTDTLPRMAEQLNRAHATVSMLAMALGIAIAAVAILYVKALICFYNHAST